MKRAPSPRSFSSEEGTFMSKRPRASSHGSIQNGSFYEVEEEVYEVKEENISTETNANNAKNEIDKTRSEMANSTTNEKQIITHSLLHQTTAKNITSFSYADLLAEKGEIVEKIGEAFGYDGLGILAVQDVPNLQQLREKLLSTGRHFAEDLSEESRKKYEHPKSYWSFGWSHGKEKLQGRPDYSKGSYYNNPVENVPYTDQKVIDAWPSFAHPNIWPSKEDEPELESSFMTLGKLMVDTGLKLATMCDKYTEKVWMKEGYKIVEKNKLKRIIKGSKVTKGRLVHYYSRSKEAIRKDVNPEFAFSSWCGWHNDHGSLTAVVPALYFKDGKIIKEGSPDPLAGLYVKSRHGKICKVVAPPNSLLFQIGETAQIHSGGVLQATPHAVRGANVAGISRTAFAVFMEPNMDELMVSPNNTIAQTNEAAKSLPKGVPPLKNRWGTDRCPFTTCSFGEFTHATLDEYH
eukprot:g9261.t1